MITFDSFCCSIHLEKKSSHFKHWHMLGSCSNFLLILLLAMLATLLYWSIRSVLSVFLYQTVLLQISMRTAFSCSCYSPTDVLSNPVPVLIPQRLTSPCHPSDHQGERQYWWCLSIVFCWETSTPCIAIKQFDWSKILKTTAGQQRELCWDENSGFLSSVLIVWRNPTWKLGNLAQHLPSPHSAPAVSNENLDTRLSSCKCSLCCV